MSDMSKFPLTDLLLEYYRLTDTGYANTFKARLAAERYIKVCIWRGLYQAIYELDA